MPNPTPARAHGSAQHGNRGQQERRHQICWVMAHSDWNMPAKPYDLRDRLFVFACVIVRVVQHLHTRGRIASALSDQLLRCGTSAGANYEEADDASSPRDKAAKRRIALREVKETRWRLRVLHKTGFLKDEHRPVIDEAGELVKILATIIRNSEES
jgi:four helix bundle protein